MAMDVLHANGNMPGILSVLFPCCAQPSARITELLSAPLLFINPTNINSTKIFIKTFPHFHFSASPQGPIDRVRGTILQVGTDTINRSLR